MPNTKFNIYELGKKEEKKSSYQIGASVHISQFITASWIMGERRGKLTQPNCKLFNKDQSCSLIYFPTLLLVQHKLLYMMEYFTLVF